MNTTKTPIYEASVEEIRERVLAWLASNKEKPNNTLIDDAILGLIAECHEKKIPVGNLPSALTRKPYTTTLLPITYFSIDDDRESMIFHQVEFIGEFGPFKKGDCLESLHLSLDGRLMAFGYGHEEDESKYFSCDCKLQIVEASK